MKEIFTNQQVKLLKKETLFQGFFAMKKYFYTHKLYQGGWSNTVEREIFERGDAVGVLLYDPPQDSFVLIEQIRPGALRDAAMTNPSPWLLEIVAGMIEEGEQPSQVAMRETLEEAGCQLKKLIPMTEYWVSPGGTTEYIYLFLGLVDSHEVANFAGLESEQEDIRVEVVTRQQLLQLMAQGRINNAMALIAVQWFLLNESQLELD
ncbi:MAG: NUDIX domain-containing protein [Kangiellaceae bacterium]|nr:NUDIX domain-containing protein [Kangiellaceae bacterium]